jgi:putative membrane protein
MMHWMFGNSGMGYGPGMGVMMFFFWLLVIIGLVLLIKALLGGGRKEEGAGDSAEEILKKRYAKGEIGEEEFRKMMSDLRGLK